MGTWSRTDQAELNALMAAYGSKKPGSSNKMALAPRARMPPGGYAALQTDPLDEAKGAQAKGRAATRERKAPARSNTGKINNAFWRMKAAQILEARGRVTASPANLEQLYNQIKTNLVQREQARHLGGGAVAQPRMVNLFSPGKIEEVAGFLRDPILMNASGSMGSSQILSRITTFFTGLHKTYHSGKGDDFESVAVTFGNPAVPISLSAAGTLSPDNLAVGPTGRGARKPSNTYGILDAMRKYGGHYITVNLAFDAEKDAITGGLHPEYKLPAEMANKGKGRGRVQLDYLIWIPAVWRGNILIKRARGIILEFKAGETQVNMNITEEQQAEKAVYLLQNWWAEDQPVIEVYYAPYLGDISRANLPRTWGFQTANYLKFEGLCQMLKLDTTVVRALADLRAGFLGSAVAGTQQITTDQVSRIRNAIRRQQQLPNGNAILPENTSAQIFAELDAESAHRRERRPNEPTAWNKFKQFSTSVPNWKGRSNRILFLMSKKNAEILKNRTAVNQINGLIKISGLIKAILTTDGNATTGRILAPEQRQRLFEQLQNIQVALSLDPKYINSMSVRFIGKLNLPKNKNVAKNYFISFIKARSKYLGARGQVTRNNQIGEIKDSWGEPGNVAPGLIMRRSTWPNEVGRSVRAPEAAPPAARAPVASWRFKSKNNKNAILNSVIESNRGFEAAYRNFISSHLTVGDQNSAAVANAASRNMAKRLNYQISQSQNNLNKAALQNIREAEPRVAKQVLNAFRATAPPRPASRKRKA